ncbi:MAG TPA: DUF928 domain-containing protein [Geminicoccaceae bacterium]
MAALLGAGCATPPAGDAGRTSGAAGRVVADSATDWAGPRYLASVDQTSWPGPKIDLLAADTRVDPTVLLGAPGDAAPLAELYAIAPPAIAYASQAQPELYWFVADAVPHPVELRVDRGDRIEPVALLRLPPGAAAGMHCFAIGEAGGSLEHDVEHTWSVRILADPEDPSNDPRAAAKLRVVPLPAATAAAVAAAPPAERPGVLLAAGFWYDGFALLMRELDQTGDAALAAYRQQLLSDAAVGLGEVAQAIAELPPAAARRSCR